MACPNAAEPFDNLESSHSDKHMHTGNGSGEIRNKMPGSQVYQRA